MATALALHAGVLDDNSAGSSKPSTAASNPPASAPGTSPATSSAPAPSTSAPSTPQSSVPAGSLQPSPSVQTLKPVLATTLGNDPYDKLAKDLAQSSGSEGKLYVSIGNFLDGDTEQLSPRSTEVKEELAIALPKTGKFEIITRERLADLQNEGKFQSTDIVQPNPESSQVGVKAVNGIIRGRISTKPEGTVIYAAIAYLNGGEVREVKAVIPSTTASPVAKVTTQVTPPSVQADSSDHQGDDRRGSKRQGNKENVAPLPAKPINPGNAKSQQSGHPLVNQINQREQRLENQVNHALANGVIKPKEAAEIRDGIQKIKRQEKQFLLQNDGFLTKPERDQLNQEEDQLGQQIRKDKKANRRN